VGTSSSFGGPNGGTPLIPSWLEPDGDTPGTQLSSNTPNTQPNSPVPPIPPPPERPELPPVADANRFNAARNNLSRFASSGGHDRASLGRAVSHYVSTSVGGARQASFRMGKSRKVGAQLLGFLSSAVTSGPREALRTLKLESLAGRPIQEIFLGLVDYICPEGGTIDDGIAREAFVETITDLAETGIQDMDSLTTDQMQTIFEFYAANAIFARLCNDVGTSIIKYPASVQNAVQVQSQLRDFIRRSVADALTTARAAFQALTPENVFGFVTRIYEQAFSILQTLGEAEADQ